MDPRSAAKDVMDPAPRRAAIDGQASLCESPMTMGPRLLTSGARPFDGTTGG